MYLIKCPEAVFYSFLIFFYCAFWSHSLFSVLTRMLILNYVLNTLVRIRRQLASFWRSRSMGHYCQAWRINFRNWMLAKVWLCFLSLHSWLGDKTWRSSFCMILIFYDVFYRFWVLVFFNCIDYFSLLNIMSAFVYSALIGGAILWLYEFSWFVLLQRALHRFYSWYHTIRAW